MKLKYKIRLFNIFNFFSALSFYFPVKLVYFHQVTGSYTAATSIISAVWIFQALLEVPTGIYSDLIGRKRTIIAGAACSVACYLMYAMGHGYWIFIFGAFLEGTARSFFSGNNNAYLHNLLADDNKLDHFHHYYGKLNSIIGISMFIAAITSGLLFYISVTLFIWVNILPQLISLGISIILPETKHEEKVNTNVYSHLKEAIGEIKKSAKLRDLSLSELFSGGGQSAYEFQGAIYSLVWPAWAIGLARAVQEAGVIPSFYFAGKIIDKVGKTRVIVINWIATVGGNILAALTGNMFSPLFVMISLPFYGAGDSAKQQLVQHEFTEKQRATLGSLYSLIASISASVILYICGIIANKYGAFVALFATQIFIIPSLYFQWKFLKRGT